jgi:pimeloyl-ACP methyl ester carboxylesterase
VRSPLLAVVCDDDATTPAQLTIGAVRSAPRAEVVRLPGGHYEPFLGGHERAVDAELSFLREHVLDRVLA